MAKAINKEWRKQELSLKEVIKKHENIPVFNIIKTDVQRRGAVFEQLVSLILQGAVVMLIISLTAILMQAIQSTTFFEDSNIKDIS